MAGGIAASTQGGEKRRRHMIPTTRATRPMSLSSEGRSILREGVYSPSARPSKTAAMTADWRRQQVRPYPSNPQSRGEGEGRLISSERALGGDAWTAWIACGRGHLFLDQYDV